jgi:hypothetical protein
MSLGVVQDTNHDKAVELRVASCSPVSSPWGYRWGYAASPNWGTDSRDAILQSSPAVPLFEGGLNVAPTSLQASYYGDAPHVCAVGWVWFEFGFPSVVGGLRRSRACPNLACVECGRHDERLTGYCQACGGIRLVLATGLGISDLSPSQTPTPVRVSRVPGLEGLRLKFEGTMPTGSFKDRVMTVLVGEAVEAGARGAVVASSGNAAVAAAAACAAAPPRLRWAREGGRPAGRPGWWRRAGAG